MNDDLPDLDNVKITLATGSLLSPVAKRRSGDELQALFQEHVRHLEPDCGWKGRVEAVVAPDLVDGVREAMNFMGALVDDESPAPDGRTRLYSEGYWAHGFDCT